MTSFEGRPLHVGDVVEHDPPDAMSYMKQRHGLLVRLLKESRRKEWNVWEVKFFSGDIFRIMEGYLKKIQGAIDTHE